MSFQKVDPGLRSKLKHALHGELFNISVDAHNYGLSPENVQKLNRFGLDQNKRSQCFFSGKVGRSIIQDLDDLSWIYGIHELD